MSIRRALVFLSDGQGRSDDEEVSGINNMKAPPIGMPAYNSRGGTDRPRKPQKNSRPFVYVVDKQDGADCLFLSTVGEGGGFPRFSDPYQTSWLDQ